MPDRKIRDAIDAMAREYSGEADTEKAKKTVHISAEQIDNVEYYRKALGYRSFSGALDAILKKFFEDLANSEK